MGISNILSGAFGTKSESPKLNSKEEAFLQWFSEALSYASDYNKHLRSETESLADVAMRRYMTKAYSEDRNLPFESRPNHNHVARVVSTILPYILANRPAIKGQARQPEHEDFAEAFSCNFDWIWEYNDMDMKMFELMLLVLLQPVAYLKSWWNPYEGGDGPGEICCGVVPMEYLFRDPDCGSAYLKDCRYVFQKIPADPFQMATMFEDIDFGDFGEGVNEFRGSGVDGGLRFGSTITDDSGNNPRTFWGQSRQSQSMFWRDDGAFYYEVYWRTPNKPRGQVAWVYKNTLLKMRGSDTRIIDNPIPHGMWPFVEFRASIVPGRIEGKSVAQDVVPLNDEHNILLGIMYDHILKMSHPVEIVPQTTGISGRELKRRFRGKIWQPADADSAKGIGFHTPPDIEEGLFKFRDVNRQAQDDIPGTHDAMAGAHGVGAYSGAAQNAQAQAALVRVDPIQKAMEWGLQGTGKLWERMIVKYYNEKRLLRTMSRFGGERYHQIEPQMEFDLTGEKTGTPGTPIGKRFAITTIKGRKPKMDENGEQVRDDEGNADYEYDSDYTLSPVDPEIDVRVVVGSSLPVNEEQKRQMMMDLAKTMGPDGVPLVLPKDVLMQFANILDVQQTVKDREQFKKDNAPQGPPPVAEKATRVLNIPADKMAPDQITAAIQAAKSAEDAPPPQAPQQGPPPPPQGAPPPQEGQ